MSLKFPAINEKRSFIFHPALGRTSEEFGFQFHGLGSHAGRIVVYLS